jgi:site-specific DNA-methyltransferase (cytosine-N4-specific)
MGTLWLNLGDGHTSGGRTTRAPDRKNPNRAPQVRPSTPFRLKPKDLLLISARLARALQQPWLACTECGREEHEIRFGWMPSGADICPSCAAIVSASVTEPGWYVRQEIVWEKPNCQTESVKDRPTRAHEHIWLLSKSARYKFNHQAIRGPNDRNIRTVWRIHTQRGQYGHVAPFPEALAAACIALSTNPGDLVLDPFLGSGTTAAVAHQLGRRYCGIELNPDYTEIAATRINNAAPGPDHKATLRQLLQGTNLIAA